MCGLTAIFSNEPSRDVAARAGAMLDLIRHRGPDDRDVVAFAPGRVAAPDEPANIALGHQRLAIVDLSRAGHQPMPDATARFWLSFNGEIYNHVELASELRAADAPLSSHCDTEVLVELWAREQAACLPRLDGMFAFLVVDLPLRRAYAVRDRFGIKPLYYWWATADELVFASEIKAFTAHPRWRPRMNGQRAADFLARGVIDHTPETLVEGVHQIPPGHWMEIDFSGSRLRTRMERWYELRACDAFSSDPREQARQCLALLRRSVQRHLRADVTVGSCLSGGLDSSTIVCLASELLRAGDESFTQKTFTARSDDPALDEWRFAGEVAAAARADAIAIQPQGRDLIDNLERFVWIQDEPFGSPSIFLQHEVFGAAAGHGVKAMLDGQGADEQFAGYHAFFGVHLADQLRRGRIGEFAHWTRRLRELHRWPARHSIAHALAATLAAPVRRALRARSPHSVGSRLIDHHRLGASPRDPFDWQLSSHARDLRGFSIHQLTAASLPMLLHWEDRSSMAHSVEARVPFLAHELVEFTLGLPPKAKLCDGMTKHVLREAMSGIVPDSVRLRTDKIAFAAPEARWLLRDHRARTLARLEEAIETLDDILTPGAEDVLAEIAHARRAYDNALWRVLCFAAWRRRFDVH